MFTFPTIATIFIVVSPIQVSCLSTIGFIKPSVISSADEKASCVAGFVHVSVSANNTNLLYSGPVNNSATTETFVEYTQVNSTIVQDVSRGPLLVTGNYSIYSKLCFPADAGLATGVETVQFLTHGGTLDLQYWDIAPNYSYVDAAASAGYATFSYDRLGTGLSSHPDPIQVVQLAIQAEIAHSFVQMLRSGRLGEYSFKKVVGVGHSFGSSISQIVTTRYPSDFDAVILTGISTSFTSALIGSVATGMQIANTDPSGRFSGLANGYFSLAPVPQAHQYAFFRYPFYDQKSQFLASLISLFPSSCPMPPNIVYKPQSQPPLRFYPPLHQKKKTIIIIETIPDPLT